MNKARWEQAKDIFDAALDLPGDTRSEYLTRACAGDDELRREVESLLAADAHAGSFMDRSWLEPFSPFAQRAEFQFRPGDVISDRFRIVRSLGHGGMGNVYKAYDSVLGVEVALKTLKSEISSNPEVLFRFRQEVRIAHRITHPNVCRTFHLDHEERVLGGDESSSVDITYLTMEYLEGETLQQMLKHSGPLPLERALEIARQMAQAIEAAHQIGVIHRDIKPSNIMVCPARQGDRGEIRVVVTDFGLAKIRSGLVSDDLSSISQQGRAMGTLSYMSPEQLQGKEVSTATDIYSLGLVLFEMVTGSKAFPDSNTMAAAYRRVLEPPPSPGERVEALPHTWEMAILGCLQIEPSARFKHVSDVIAAIEGLSSHAADRRLPLEVDRAQSFGAGKKSTWIGVAIALSLLTLGFRYLLMRGDAAVAPGTLVYLAPVTNETGEKRLDNLTELVRAGLQQSAQINMVDAGHASDILQQMKKAPDAAIDAPTAREIAMRAGAARIVIATLTGSAGSYRLHVDLQQPDNTPTRPRHVWSSSWTWQSTPTTADTTTISPSLLGIVREASDWIRHEVGESSNDIARLDVPPEDVTTSNWKALSEYTDAEHLISSFDRVRAVDVLENAVRTDPEFATAYGRLGDVLDSVGRNLEGYDAYHRALQVESESRLTRRERDRIRGMFALDTGDEPAAEASFRDYANYYENDYAGWFFRAYPLMMLNRLPEAIETLKKAFAVDSKRLSAPDHLVRCYMLSGDLDEAWKWQKWIQANGYPYDAAHEAALLHMQEGRYMEAEGSFRAMLQDPEPYDHSIAEAFVARYDAERGDLAHALEMTNEGIAYDQSNGLTSLEASKYIDRAAIACSLHTPAVVPSDVREAVKLHPDPDLMMMASDVLGACVADNNLTATIAAPVFVDMLRSLPKQDESLLYQAAVFRIHGELLLTQGRPKKALAEMLKATNLEAPVRSRAYLARTYLKASADEREPVRKVDLKDKALKIYRDLAHQPGWTWNSLQWVPPGAYAKSLEAYLRALPYEGAEETAESSFLRGRIRELQAHSTSSAPLAGMR